MSEATIVSIEILERSLQLKCKPEEAEKLKEAGAYLDAKMREIHDSGNAVGYERTAMLAAIDVCFELMTMREEKDLYGEEIHERLQNLNTRVTDIISSSELNIPQRSLGEQQKLAL